MSRIAALLLIVALPLPRGLGAEPLDADSLLDRWQIRRGICVVVDPPSAQLPIKLLKQSELLVVVQTSDASVGDALQSAGAAAGLLGQRLYVLRGAADSIALAANLADAAVLARDAAVLAGGETTEPVRQELLRVTHPGARILIGDRTIVNPRPAGADDWSHPYHGPDNNPQSRDRHTAGPYLTQFLAEPWYVPMPQVTVAAGGRLFKAFGHIALKQREWPWLNKLVAVNGYNGTMLWQRDLAPGFMLHRNTLIATPERVYLGDASSCKILDAASGRLLDEIVIDSETDVGGVWKWMALHDGVLYALVGAAEPVDKVIRGQRTQAGWPWTGLGQGYGKFGEKYQWGFGRTLLAIDPKSKQILWTHRAAAPVDSRAMCLSHGSIYTYSHERFLASVDAASGKLKWKTTDLQLLSAIGQHDRAQTAPKGFASTAYAKANDKGIYFAGPQRTNLLAVSAKDGSLMWSHPHGNFQLVLRDDALYAMGRTETSKAFDYLSGRVLADLQCYRGNCTRATATTDSIFTRGYRHTGTMQLDLAGNRPRRIALMRPACQDGVIIAEGQLYWGPWMCDCNHSLIGMISLASSEGVDTVAAADPSRQLQVASPAAKPKLRAASTPGDWPAYRGNAARSATSPAAIPNDAMIRWQTKSPSRAEPTAPVVVDGTAYHSGLDGVVFATDVATGKTRWTAYTEGAVRFPPEYSAGRLLVGSSDGHVYCFDAGSGATMWRFRAAPADRRIAVHGRLMSNWPVGSGVLVDNEVVYAAAGITSYDGTHVYALNAKTGGLRWHNNHSGQLSGGSTVTGVSVQGHLLLHDGKLHLAGGNVVSPAVYSTQDGRCLNHLKGEWWEGLDEAEGRFPPGAASSMFHRSPRGRELFVVDGEVRVFDRLLYSPPDNGPSRYFGGHFLQAGDDDVSVRGTTDRIVRLAPRPGPDGKPQGIWESTTLRDPAALAVCANAVVVAGEAAVDTDAAGTAKPPQPRYVVAALNLSDGKPLWQHPLPARPVPWGLAIDRQGSTIVTLATGAIVCVK